MPYVEEPGYYFLKAVVPSRQATRDYLRRSNPDEKPDAFEQEILTAYDKGELKSTSPSRDKLAKFKAAASATFLKEKRVNIRISTPDLMDIQARALEEGMRYQTLIASVLHKYVSGRFVECSSSLKSRSSDAKEKRRTS